MAQGAARKEKLSDDFGKLEHLVGLTVNIHNMMYKIRFVGEGERKALQAGKRGV